MDDIAFVNGIRQQLTQKQQQQQVEKQQNDIWESVRSYSQDTIEYYDLKDGLSISDEKNASHRKIHIGQSGKHSNHILRRIKLTAYCPGIVLKSEVVQSPDANNNSNVTNNTNKNNGEGKTIPYVSRVQLFGALMLKSAIIRQGKQKLCVMSSEGVDIIRNVLNTDIYTGELEGRFKLVPGQVLDIESASPFLFSRDLHIPFSSDFITTQDPAVLNMNCFPIYLFPDGLELELNLATLNDLFHSHDGEIPYILDGPRPLTGKDIRFTLEVHCSYISDSEKLKRIEEITRNNGKLLRCTPMILAKSCHLETHNTEDDNHEEDHYQNMNNYQNKISDVKDGNSLSSMSEMNSFEKEYMDIPIKNISATSTIGGNNNNNNNNNRVVTVPNTNPHVTKTLQATVTERDFPVEEGYVCIPIANVQRVKAFFVTYQLDNHINNKDFRRYDAPDDLTQLPSDPIEEIGLIIDNRIWNQRLRTALQARKDDIRDHTLKGTNPTRHIYGLVTSTFIDSPEPSGYLNLAKYKSISIIIKKAPKTESGTVKVWMLCEDIISISADKLYQNKFIAKSLYCY